MKTKLFWRLFLFTVLAVGFAGPGRAQDSGAIKSRMAQRLGAIDGLKDRGIAGENNRGYLEARGAAGGEEQRLISEENTDRRAAYTLIAQQTNSDVDAVGRARAQRIAIGSKRGVWIQEASGEWRQKS
ncbi:MAG: hypothetical protein B9S34_02755 [Opitutia bacterium Tous-C1TDCM]|nr:MAG: hypothetical protein B9S34_02755 [Opitutae bacterium Tous-C1TDCM]